MSARCCIYGEAEAFVEFREDFRRCLPVVYRFVWALLWVRPSYEAHRRGLRLGRVCEYQHIYHGNPE